ncbi:hypothetical protein [Clostridium kluyveri]|uniref:Uncharacterized protein n=1 Tax=Clostridium kluyveri TaxID=1534 RepID=A0A1L5F8P5_CLOKL|nr:hypothetical protein [Clostridium kluyveri]APM39401.1 hypothetical protein BS101_11940 [Clostridium kluyveri]
MSRFYPKFDKYIPSDVQGKKAERSYIAHFKVSATKATVASTTGIHAAVTSTASPSVVTTGITQPSVPRNITATAGGTATDIKAIQVVIEGTNYAGETITETLPAFTVDTAGTVTGSKAFKTITKITIPAHDGTGATTAIGFGEKLGLPYKLAHNTVLASYLDNTKESTAPVVTIDSANLEGNTIDLNSSLNSKVVDAYLIV